MTPETIVRAQAGDKAARDEIVLHFLPLIRHIAGQYSSRSIHREDMVSEAIVGLLETLPEYDPKLGGLAPFVHGVVKNRCRKLLVGEKRFSDRWLSAWLEVAAPEDDESESGALELLPAAKAALLRRYYGIGRPADPKDSIAEDLGIAPSALWKRVERIKQELRRELMSRKTSFPRHGIESN